MQHHACYKMLTIKYLMFLIHQEAFSAGFHINQVDNVYLSWTIVSTDLRDRIVIVLFNGTIQPSIISHLTKWRGGRREEGGGRGERQERWRELKDPFFFFLFWKCNNWQDFCTKKSFSSRKVAMRRGSAGKSTFVKTEKKCVTQTDSVLLCYIKPKQRT